MGPTWVLSAPDGPHVGPMNLAIRVSLRNPAAYFSKYYSPYRCIAGRESGICFVNYRFQTRLHSWLVTWISSLVTLGIYWCQLLNREWRCSWSSTDSFHFMKFNNIFTKTCSVSEVHAREIMISWSMVICFHENGNPWKIQISAIRYLSNVLS